MKEIPGLLPSAAEAFQEAREYARLSQAQLAERAGCARSFVSFLETGTHLPGLNAFVALAEAMELRPSELMRRIEEKMAFRQMRQ